MRLAYLFALAMAGCVVPAQQPGYFQGGQPPPAQAQAGGPPAAAGASCQDTMVCYGQCNPLSDQCVGACDQRTTPDSAQNAHALLQCMAQSGCQDQSCVAQACSAQITTCTGVTVQTAQGGSSPPAPASYGGGGVGTPDEVMTPQYYKGTTDDLIVPPPDRTLTQADLAGDWAQGSGAISQYVNASTGNYAGYSSVSTSSKWSIDRNGNFVEHAKVVTSNSGAALAHGVSEDSTGSMIMLPNNTVRITENPNEYHSQVEVHDYIIVGWFQGKDAVVMSLQGPFDDPPTQKDYDDVQSNSYKNEKYARKR